jgi:preprotein translocase subunit SecD
VQPSGSVNPSQSAAAAANAAKLAAVQAKLGSAWGFAEQYLQQVQQMQQQNQDPSSLISQPGVLTALTPFARLDPSEVAVLPLTVQYYLPTVECSQLNARPGLDRRPEGAGHRLRRGS